MKRYCLFGLVLSLIVWKGGAVETAPRLFFTEKTIDEYRSRCAKGGDLANQARDLCRVAKMWVGKPLTPEPPPLTGLKGPARNQLYKEIFTAIRPQCARMTDCALAYILTGDAQLGAEAKRRLIHYTGFDPKGSTNTFHNDEPAMSILRRGCRAYDWTRDLYTPEERAKIENCLVIRAEDVYRLLQKNRFHVDPRNSHLGRQIGFLLEACIALEKEHPEMAMWREYVLSIYRTVYPAWGGDDGGWNEGPHYWSYYMGFGYESLLAYSLAGGEDILRSKAFFRNTPWYFIYQCPPGSPISPFGDGDQTAPYYSTILRAFAELQDDPALTWFAEQAPPFRPNELLAFLCQKKGSPPPRPTDLPGTRLFEKVGLVCSHTDVTASTNDVAFYFRASPYGSVSHGHNDQNCFALTAWGEPLAIPTGYYNFFGSTHHGLWTWSTRAKCGITYDDVPSQIRGPRAASRLYNYQVVGDLVTFSGDATAAYGGVLKKAVRDVVRVGRDVFVMRDTLESDQPHVFKYWLHATDRMQIDETANRVTIVRPRAVLDVTFLTPTKLTFAQTDEYDPPPVAFMNKIVKTWHLSAATPASNKMEIVSVLVVRRSGEDVVSRTFELTAGGVEMVTAVGRRQILFPTEEHR